MPLTTVDSHFLRMSQQLGQKNDQHSSKRGCIITQQNRVVASGVSMHLGGNLFKPEVESEKYIATVSAEVVAISEAVKNKAELSQCTCYTSNPPTWPSFKLLVTLGIRRMVCYGPITTQRIQHYAQELGIDFIVVG